MARMRVESSVERRRIALTEKRDMFGAILIVLGVVITVELSVFVWLL